MILNFSDFVNESDEQFQIAKSLLKNSKIQQALSDCKDGKFRHISINSTPGIKSYVGVAINDGDSISKVYKTTDPFLALLEIIIKNSKATRKIDPETIYSILTTEDGFLSYAVFPGDRPMSQQEVADKYNITYKVPPGDAITYYTSTPIRKIL